MNVDGQSKGDDSTVDSNSQELPQEEGPLTQASQSEANPTCTSGEATSIQPMDVDHAPSPIHAYAHTHT